MMSRTCLTRYGFASPLEVQDFDHAVPSKDMMTAGALPLGEAETPEHGAQLIEPECMVRAAAS